MTLLYAENLQRNYLWKEVTRIYDITTSPLMLNYAHDATYVQLLTKSMMIYPPVSWEIYGDVASIS